MLDFQCWIVIALKHGLVLGIRSHKRAQRKGSPTDYCLGCCKSHQEEFSAIRVWGAKKSFDEDPRQLVGRDKTVANLLQATSMDDEHSSHSINIGFEAFHGIALSVEKIEEKIKTR